ncbi:MAG: NAD(P)-dependent oxidoreductase [Chloroflexi bacterium]|nr:NAD(P)-dependent oxidoreductase [Chloroflexota bacterium]
MSTLVIGGTGFIGSAVVRRLVAAGDAVVCFDRAVKAGQFDDLGVQVPVVLGDVTHIGELWAAIREYEVGRIVHLGYVLGADIERHPHLSTAVNVLGVSNVFEAARLSGLKRVVFASSTAIHGDPATFGDHPVSEADGGTPIGLYGAQKVYCEALARSVNRRYQMEIVTLRVSMVFGPGRERGFAHHNGLITESALGRRSVIPYVPEATLAAIHVADVADLLVRLVQAPRVTHPVYETGGHYVSLAELSDVVRELIPTADIEFTGRFRGLNAVDRIDNRRACEEFGFALTPLRESVRNTIDEVRRAAGRTGGA